MRIEVTAETVFTTEVDVSIEDVVEEWFSRLEEPDQGGLHRTVGSMLHAITSLMARLTDETIQEMPPTAREEMRKRLEIQSARYQER